MISPLNVVPAPLRSVGRHNAVTHRPACIAMHVSVRTQGNGRHEYQGLFGHTFDAYDHAMETYLDAARIEVKVLGGESSCAAGGRDVV